MTRLPRISGKDIVRKLKDLGFEVFDQSGSHVYLHKWDGCRRKKLVAESYCACAWKQNIKIGNFEEHFKTV